MAATQAQRDAAFAVLRDGGSYARAARAAGVNRKTVERWSHTEVPPSIASSPEAILRGLLFSDNERTRLDAATRLITLELDAEPAVPDYDRVEISETLPTGAKPYSVLTVYRPAASPTSETGR